MFGFNQNYVDVMFILNFENQSMPLKSIDKKKISHIKIGHIT